MREHINVVCAQFTEWMNTAEMKPDLGLTLKLLTTYKKLLLSIYILALNYLLNTYGYSEYRKCFGKSNKEILSITQSSNPKRLQFRDALCMKIYAFCKGTMKSCWTPRLPRGYRSPFNSGCKNDRAVMKMSQYRDGIQSELHVFVTNSMDMTGP